MIASSIKRCQDSPGAIVGDEDVALGLYSPELFDPITGKIRPEAIRIEQLRGPHNDVCGNSTGVSVCRILTSRSFDELWDILAQIISRRPTRRLEGYAIANVDLIWKIGEDRIVAVDVLDDGRTDYPDHAVIRGTPGLGRGALRGPRNDLIELFNANVVLEDRTD